MNEDINTLYSNSLGVSFTWKKTTNIKFSGVQLVFKETGLNFKIEELLQFEKQIKASIKQLKTCGDCKLATNCKQILLETPIPKLSFAMNITELFLINELVEGTLFQLQLNNMLAEINVKH